MGTTFAPPYACLPIGYLEETILYPQLKITFNLDLADTIMEFYYRYMGDELLPWPNDADINIFKELLNILRNKIEFTLKPATRQRGCVHSKINFSRYKCYIRQDG